MKKFLFVLLLTSFLSTSVGVMPSYAVSTDTCYDTDASFMLHMDGVDTSTTFTDSSTNGHTFTANGNAQVDTAQSKFGGASGLFDGSGDFLEAADHSTFDLSTGDFTIDFWFRNNTNIGDYRDWGHAADVNSIGGHNGAGNLYTFINSNFTNSSGVFTPSTATWYHAAVTRSSGTVKYFIDGVQKASYTDAGDMDAASVLRIAVGSNGVSSKDGWFDEFRMVKGTAIWTANFTPPSSEYTACGGVSRRLIVINSGA